MKNKKPFVEAKYLSGDIIYLFGEKYILDIKYIEDIEGCNKKQGAYLDINTETDTSINTETKTNKIHLYIYKRNDTFEKKEKHIYQLYKEILKPVAEDLTEKWANIMNVEYGEINLRKTKRIWGSFNTKTKDILYNTKLATKPVNLIEYITVHELCHSKYANHGKGFKDMLTYYMPDWKERKKLLFETEWY